MLQAEAKQLPQFGQLGRATEISFSRSLGLMRQAQTTGGITAIVRLSMLHGHCPMPALTTAGTVALPLVRSACGWKEIRSVSWLQLMRPKLR